MAKKYYVDLNGKFGEILSDWNECQKYMKELGGLNFKSFPSIEVAKSALADITSQTVNTKTSQTSNASANQTDRDNMYLIGCDEVGKVEPFKQLMSVAVFADPNVSRNIKGGDSKKHSKEQNIEIGKLITGLSSYTELDGKAHYIEKYGIIYCVKVVPNKYYNFYKDAKKNANCVLSFFHNEALMAVYDEAKARGYNVDAFVIDDYMSNSLDHSMQFKKYVLDFKSDAKTINDIVGTKIILTTKAEDKYPDTVGLASNIGDFIDQLWQERVIELFMKDGIDFKPEWFSNFGADAQNEINKVFDLLKEKYGDIDSAPVTCKHTSYYSNYCVR